MVCTDKCEDCPLYTKGCGAKCVRWNDLVCNDCPCLGSAYADVFGPAETVDPKTDKDKAADPVMAELSKLRRTKKDGQALTADEVKDCVRRSAGLPK